MLTFTLIVFAEENRCRIDAFCTMACHDEDELEEVVGQPTTGVVEADLDESI